ncbi:MAG TPA: TonB-dependent receptor [Acidobacteriaceae bacterium]|nr:TonB-dependent receptor [Acidobacteriaceae bacterium]
MLGISGITAAQTLPPIQAPPAATLSGTVADPSGARIRHAALHIHSDSLDRDILTNDTGVFTASLPPGGYTLAVEAPGFRILTRDDIELRAGSRLDLKLRLAIATHPEEVSVNPFAASTNPDDNGNAVSFSGNQLQVLSDDPTTLREQLLAMAGAGPGGAQFYVDGFSNGQLPPKSAIRSIRINNNPYSAEFDRAGFGRIQIETRAGGNKLHGTFDVAGSDAAFNARNPYTGAQPPYYQLFFDGNLNGPVDKKTTFFLAGNSTDLQNNAVVNAADPNAPSTNLSEAVPNPQRDDDYSLRLDRQISATNSINGRYEIHRTHLTNAGVGLFVLPSEGYAANTLVQTLQLDDNDIINPKIVSDARFQYIRTRLGQDPNDTSPALIVEGAFSGGGSPSQTLRNNLDHYELQEDLSIDHGAHFIRAGARYRLYRDSSYSNGGYNGQFLFPNVTAYQITEQGLANHESDSQIRATCVPTSTGPVCGGATQFNLTAGRASAAVFTGDLGLYADDAWKLTPHFTLSLGLRYESQSAIADHSNLAPRVGFAWALGSRKAKAPILTLRGGAGIFYTRFDVANLLQAVTQNGISQTAYFVQNPSFFTCTSSSSGLIGEVSGCTVPQASTLPSSEPTLYRVDPHFHTAYDIVTSITAERTIGRIGAITANLLQGHGAHGYLLLNANAPLPGTYNPADPNSGTRPLGNLENIYQYTSEGSDYGRIFFSNFNLHPTSKLFFWGFYIWDHSYGDANSASEFASNPYDIHQDYGREDNNATQQLFCGFSWNLPRGFSLQPFMSTHSGKPFNITTGTDLNGDTIYNDRPAFATDLSRSSVARTVYGTFDTDPLPTQTIIPYNYGRAPGLIWFDLQASKSFHLGPRPALASSAKPPSFTPLAAQGAAAKPASHPAAPPERPWALTFMVEVQNLFNHNNPGPPVGVLSSPYFGQSISIASDFSSLTAANRSLSLHASFTF